MTDTERDTQKNHLIGAKIEDCDVLFETIRDALRKNPSSKIEVGSTELDGSLFESENTFIIGSTGSSSSISSELHFSQDFFKKTGGYVSNEQFEALYERLTAYGYLNKAQEDEEKDRLRWIGTKSRRQENGYYGTYQNQRTRRILLYNKNGGGAKASIDFSFANKDEELLCLERTLRSSGSSEREINNELDKERSKFPKSAFKSSLKIESDALWLHNQKDFIDGVQEYIDMYADIINALYDIFQTERPDSFIKIDVLMPNKIDNGKSKIHPFGNIQGQDEAVKEAKKLVQGIRNPGIYKKWGSEPTKSILFLGPPGTGKTSIAKAIAEEADAEYMEIDCSEVFEKWVGQSERNLQEIFDDAVDQSRNKRVVLFFDDIDGLGASREESYEIGRKVLTVFLKNLDKVRTNPNLIILASTNRIEDVDPALKRSGRFDKLVEMPLPDSKGRVAIIKKYTEKVEESAGGKVFGKIDFDKISDQTNGLSGADLENLVKLAIEQKVSEEMEGKPSSPISTEDLLDFAFKMVVSRSEKVAIDLSKKK